MAWIEDKQVVITGATSGIGKEVAVGLARRGARVVLGCRDRRAGAQAAAEVNGAVGAERTTAMTVDTSSRSSIREFVTEYHGTHGSLDVLVNNAGVLSPDRRTSVDGIELTLATNVLGYFLVTTGLLGVLQAGTPSRVVNVASTFVTDVDLDDLQFDHRPYDGLAAYAQSKACDRLLTWALARRLPPDRVTVNAVAPGLMLGTRLYRDLTSDARRDLAQYGSRSVSAGARTVLWLASSPEVGGVTGTFFEDESEIPCQLRDEDTEERLWEACQHLSGSIERADAH